MSAVIVSSSSSLCVLSASLISRLPVPTAIARLKRFYPLLPASQLMRVVFLPRLAGVPAEAAVQLTARPVVLN